MLIILGLHCKYLLLVQFMVEIFYRKKMGMVTLKQIENFLPKNDILNTSIDMLYYNDSVTLTTN